MSADEKQVSGDHYRTKTGGVQHWTYCIRAEIPNLEYAASKYITRWRKKGGLKDIEKAIHYMEKRLESFDLAIGASRGGRKITAMFEEFLRDNKVPHNEGIIIDSIMHWSSRNQLAGLILFMKTFLMEEEKKAEEETQDYNPNQDR